MSSRRWVVAALILLVGAVPGTSQECAREVARWGYGPARVVAVNGDTAVFTSGLVLMVADVSDPTDPVVVGQMDLEDGISDIALQGSHAVAVNDHGGILVVDLEEPSRPRPLGSLDATWVGEKVLLDRSYAWVAAGRRGLRVVDLVDPSRPVEVGALGALPLEREASDVALVGSFAYVAGGELHVVDVSDSTSPVLVGSHDLWGFVTGVAAAGDRVLVGSSWAAWSWSPATTTLTAMDATDPRNPAPVGALELDGWLSAMALSGDRVVFTKGPTAFSDRLWADVVDVSDPTAPALLRTARTSLTSNDGPSTGIWCTPRPSFGACGWST